MPRGDGTGPAGVGPMTGRGAGSCAGFGTAGCGFGMGFGRSRAGSGAGFGGRGWRNWFHATGLPYWMRTVGPQSPDVRPNPDVQKQALRNQAQALEAELDSIKKRLTEMDAGTERQ
jgi:hypothetical protein